MRPLVHDRDAVAHAHGLDLVVGDVDRRRAHPPLESLQLVARRGAPLGIEVGERLVEQEDGRLAHQGPRQGDPLPLPAGELARFAVEEGVDAEDARRPVDPFVCSALGSLAALRGKAMLL